MTNNKKQQKKKVTGSKKPVYAFVDNENVNVSVQKQGWKPDWGRIYEWLQKEFDVQKVYMFMGYHPDYEQMYEFFSEIGYHLIFRKMHTGDGVPLKGNIDTELVLQAMIDYKHYSQAVIVSGDGDFACLIGYLHHNNKLKALVVPNKHRYSGFFHDVINEDEIITLTDHKKKLKYSKNSKTRKIMEKVKEGESDEASDSEEDAFWL